VSEIEQPQEEPEMDVACPFCGEPGFDLIGLKLHLLNQWCDEFNEVGLG
jgi:hypothetical protein